MKFCLKKLLLISAMLLSAHAGIAQSLSSNVSGARVNSGVTQEAYKKPDNKIDISKVKIELKKNQKSDFFTVYNRSDTEAFGFSVEAFKWSQENGKNKLEKSENILLSPKTFVIAPRQYKNIRLIAQNYPEALKDYSYRLVLTQVTRQAVEKEDSESNKLKVNLTVTMPVFFYSQEFKEADKMNIVALIDNKEKKLTLTNSDNQHVYIKSVNVGRDSYKYGWYLLPGNSISVPMNDIQEGAPIEIVTDRVTVIK